MAKRKKQHGPKSTKLKIDKENWEDAVKKAIQKEKPKDGCPDKDKKKS